MSKHTPGPWHQRGFRVYTGELGNGISRTIADFNFGRIRDCGMRMTAGEFAEAEANLALFLAAPDLLAASKLALDELAELLADDPETYPVVIGLRRAIAKAEGRDP